MTSGSLIEEVHRLRTEHFATAANGNTTQSSEIGYADDLVSVHSLASEIQRKAEIMSAFCLICGVTLSYKNSDGPSSTGSDRLVPITTYP